jgi:hypothetical protein
MALCPNREEILEAVAIIKPNVLLSVPTLFNRVSPLLALSSALTQPWLRSTTGSMPRSALLHRCARRSSTLLWLWPERGTTRRSTASPSPLGSSSSSSWRTRCGLVLFPRSSPAADRLQEGERGSRRSPGVHRLWWRCDQSEGHPILRRHRHPSPGGVRPHRDLASDRCM